MAGACNKPAEGPATRPGAAATRPATMPTSAVFRVNRIAITFASPRVALDRHDGTTRLLIYSDEDHGSGSFYFEMPIEDDALGAEPVQWEMRLEQTQRADTLIGIESPERTLQPIQLAISTQSTGDGIVHVELHGKFLVYGPDNDDPTGQPATVEAEFAAKLVAGQLNAN